VATALHPAVAQQLRRHLHTICHQAGIACGDATLIKYTMNAVYHVGPYVLRLAHGPHAAALAQRTVAVAAALAAADASTIRLADDLAVAQPVVSGDWVATIWQHVPTVAAEPKPVHLAAPLRTLHALDRLDGIGLPRWAPIDKFRRRLDAAAHLPAPDAADLDAWARTQLGLSRDAMLHELRRRCDDLDHALAAVSWRFSHGVIHNDAHTGNLLLPRTPHRAESDPTALLCDLDGICHGPREWDLVPTAHGVTRFGRPATDYHAFTDLYGFDITTWPGWPVLRDVRELQLVTSTLDSATGRPEVADQLAHRLRSLLTGDTTAVWTRHS
jgi:hypothetical protein